MIFGRARGRRMNIRRKLMVMLCGLTASVALAADVALFEVVR